MLAFLASGNIPYANDLIYLGGQGRRGPHV